MFETKQKAKLISRQILSNGIKQKIKFHDERIQSNVLNKKKLDKIAQFHLGKSSKQQGYVCSCDAKIRVLLDDAGAKCVNTDDYTVKGTGGNTGESEETSDRKYILNIISNWGLKNLANIPNVQYLPGRCAEPHAVADALKELDLRGINHKNIKEVKEIWVSDAKNEHTQKTIPRCATCQQWVPSNVVLNKFLKLS